MALVVKDRVKENTTTTGTANLTLGGAVYGFQSFSVIGNGNTTYYAIYDSATGDWEVGLGTYSTTGPTLSRDTVLESSNAGSKVSFGAGSKDVFCTYPAERSVYLDGAGSAVTLLDVGTLGAGTANITAANITAGTVSTTPATNYDLVNKQYVDSLVAAGISYHTPVKYEVPLINLNATYNNGVAGVGATLTNAGTLVAFTPDGTTASVGDRILVYNQTNAAQNGVYTVTTVGSGSVAWVLTRASDANTYGSGANALDEGSAFYVTSGTDGAGESYVCNTAGLITFGTTAITFAQISDTQIYSAGVGLTLSGTQFSITPTGTAGTYGSASQVPVLTTNASGQVTSVTNTAIAISAGAVSGLAPSATTDTTNASNITSGTLPTGRISGSYTGLTGVGTLTAGTWNATTIAAGYGGTGQSSYTVGDLLYASGTSALSKLADVAYGNVLLSGGVGTAPSYGKVNLTDHITGTLAVVNGGTGATTASGARSNLGLVIGTDIPSPTGTGASGTWNINVTGSAGSAGTATTAAYATYAGYVANTVTFNNSGAGAASGNGFNGSGALTVSYNTIGAPSTTGSGASGTWGINISGNAATATSATSATTATSLTNFTAATSGNASGVDSPTTLDVVGYCVQSGLPFGQGDGGLYTAGYSTDWYHQIFGDFRTGQIAVRGKNSGTWQAWRTVLDSSNYSSYALPLSGGTMTGTITGGSSVSTLLTGNYAGVNRGQVYNDTGGFGLLSYVGGWAVRVDYGSNSVYMPGTAYSTTDMRAPIYYDYNNTAYYVQPSSYSQMYSLAASSYVYGGYLRSGSNVYTDQNYGYGLIGVYSSYRYQGVFAMGDAYKLPADGTTTGNLYGMAWSHPNAGGIASNLNSHGLLLLQNGSFMAALSTNGTFSADVRGTIFYDYSNTGYYVDPASFSYLNRLGLAGGLSNETNITRVVSPGGGDFKYNTYSAAGAIKIRLPQTWVNTMLRFTVKVYTYDGLSFDITCGGYNYSAGYWVNTFAYMGTADRPAQTVRFAHDGTYCCVFIGELAGSWSYPQIAVTDVQLGYSSYSAANWDSGWSVSLETSSFGAVTATQTVYPPTSSVNNTNPAYASIYYDANNTGYYVDPSSGSYLYSLALSGASYFQPNNWIQFNGSYGLYWPSFNGAAEFGANNSSSYATLRMAGARNGYSGLYDAYSGWAWMNDSSANGGFYREGSGLWSMYFNYGNGCWGLNTSTTFSGWDMYGPKGFTAGTRMDSPIYYDANNTGYYVDPSSNSRINALYLDAVYCYGNVTAYASSDRKFKENIRPISNALDIVLAVGGKLFDWTDEYLADNGGENAYLLPKQSFGIVAQDLLPHLPQAIRTRQDGSLAVDYEKLSAVAFEAVRILEARVAQLEARQ